MDNKNDQTHFGFKTVNSKEKSGLVGEIFSNVANKYDLMNDVMSLGVHRYWKAEFLSHFNGYNIDYLDLASGSGDIAYKFIKECEHRHISPKSVVVSDINENMLKEAKDKFINRGIFEGIEYKIIDAENIPFPDNSFDLVTIAFGIRNVTNIDNALKEIYRVLKPMGKFLCLEFSKVDSKLEKIYDIYSFKIIPELGQLITKNREAYQYLVESIRKFPDQESFEQMINNAGFTKTGYKNLTFGVSAIHWGYKI